MFQRLAHAHYFLLYFYLRNKYEWDRMNRIRDGHSNLCKTADGRDLGFGSTGRSIRSAVPKNPNLGSNTKSIGRPFRRYGHLDLVQPEIAPFDPPTSKTLVPYPRTKHEVDRMTRCRDMAVRNFPKCEVGRSVGPQYIHCSHTLRNVAREE